MANNLNEIRQKHLDNDVDDIEYCKDCKIWALFPNYWTEKTDGTWSDQLEV